MQEKIKRLIEELHFSKTMEQMFEKEDEIAGLTGKNFIRGSLGKKELDSITETVAEAENTLRNQFERQKTVSRAGVIR